jgi:hypothetical protein
MAQGVFGKILDKSRSEKKFQKIKQKMQKKTHSSLIPQIP